MRLKTERLKGMTPVMFHASQSNLKMVKWFSKYRKNIGVLDNNGRNALFHVYGEKCAEITKHLLERGEDPNIADNLWKTPRIRV